MQAFGLFGGGAGGDTLSNEKRSNCVDLLHYLLADAK